MRRKKTEKKRPKDRFERLAYNYPGFCKRMKSGIGVQKDLRPPCPTCGGRLLIPDSSLEKGISICLQCKTRSDRTGKIIIDRRKHL